jgi:hypothetical protein
VRHERARSLGMHEGLKTTVPHALCGVNQTVYEQMDLRRQSRPMHDNTRSATLRRFTQTEPGCHSAAVGSPVGGTEDTSGLGHPLRDFETGRTAVSPASIPFQNANRTLQRRPWSPASKTPTRTQDVALHHLNSGLESARIGQGVRSGHHRPNQ